MKRFANTNTIAVQAGELFEQTATPATDSFIVYTSTDTVYDRRETLFDSSGKLAFRAPYSRFYNLLLNNTFKDVLAGSVVGSGGVVYQNSPQVLSQVRFRIYKNGAEITSFGENGIFRSDGTVSGIFVKTFASGSPVWSLSEDGTIDIQATLGGALWLEEGDELTFSFNSKFFTAAFLHTAGFSSLTGTELSISDADGAEATSTLIEDNQAGSDFYLEISEIGRE